MSLNINDVPLHLMLKYFKETSTENSNFYKHQKMMRKMTSFSDIPAWVYHKDIKPREIILTKSKNKSEFAYYDEYSIKTEYSWSDTANTIENTNLKASIENVLLTNKNMKYSPGNNIKETYFKPHYTELFIEDFPNANLYVDTDDFTLEKDSLVFVDNSLLKSNDSTNIFLIRALERLH